MEINAAEALLAVNLLLATLVVRLALRRLAPLPVAPVHECADPRACLVCNPLPLPPSAVERLLGRAWRVLHGPA